MFASDKKVLAVKPLQALFARDPLDGLNSGVPTRTTSTLTPTTLRSVEQTFVEIPVQVEVHQNQARFVPPIIQTSNIGQQPIKTSNILNVVTKSWQGGCTRVADPATFSVDMTAKASPAQTRRNVGGRKPMKDKSISPEEEERRKVRRERNKQAAARCRKRRLDRTNELLMQTDDLQEQKQGLQNEIEILQSTKVELQFLLENHPCCQLESPASPDDDKPPLPFVVVKEEPDFPLDETKTFTIPDVRKRPTTLPVPAFPPTSTTIDGIPISTPSTGINFNFDSLMEGGTGLTPVSGPLIPSCSVQQRNSGCGDLSSPDGPGSEKKLSQI